MTASRDELYEALVAERYGAPPLPPVRPVPVHRGDPPADDPPTGVLVTPVEPAADGDVLRLAGFGWTATQIAAVIQRDELYVTQVLARHGRGPSDEEGTAA